MADNTAMREVIDQMLEEAGDLAEERAEVLERQAANRALLRNHIRLGHGTKAQADKVEEFYPARTRGGGEEEPESNGQ